MRKTLCLPFLLHSLWSLSLLILCIQNHPRAKICLLVLEPPPNVKPAYGCNVLHVDTDLQKVPQYIPSPHSFRNDELYQDEGRNIRMCICVNIEYSFISRVILFLLITNLLHETMRLDVLSFYETPSRKRTIFSIVFPRI